MNISDSYDSILVSLIFLDTEVHSGVTADIQC